MSTVDDKLLYALAEKLIEVAGLLGYGKLKRDDWNWFWIQEANRVWDNRSYSNWIFTPACERLRQTSCRYRHNEREAETW
jgi:hypothetical protein